MNPLDNSHFAALTLQDHEFLLPKLTLVSLKKHQVLFDIGRVPSHVFFPVSAIVSMMNDLPDGHTIELHMLG